MFRALSIVAVLVCGDVAFAQRTGSPPSSITVTMSGFAGGGNVAIHNGTFVLTGQNNVNGVWSYEWQDRQVNPRAKWTFRVNSANEILIGAGSGQFPAGNFSTVGDVYLVNSAPQVGGGLSVQFKANP